MNPIIVMAVEGLTYQLDTPNKWTHLSNGHTYQMDSLIGLDLKLSKWAPKEPPKTRLEWSPSV